MQIGRLLVIGQALDEHATVLFFQNAIIKKNEKPAVVKRTDQASEALFQRDHGGGDLILKECIAAVRINCFHARRDYRIAGHGEGKPVDNDATELFALNVHSLPKR